MAAAAFVHRWRTRRAIDAPLAPPRLVPDVAAHVDVAPQSYCYQLRTTDPRHRWPRVLVAAPFAVFPPRHGGARRVAGLLGQLRRDHDVILVGDEASLYDARSFVHFDGLLAVRLLQRDDRGPAAASRSLAERMRAHVHPAFEAAVRDAIERHRPALVQVEHVELADLVRMRQPGQRWVLDLHDAYGPDDFDEPEAARRFAERHAARLRRRSRCAPPRMLRSCATGASWSCRTAAASHWATTAPRPARRCSSSDRSDTARTCSGIRAFLRDAYPSIRDSVPDVSLVVLGGDEAPSVAAADPLFAQPGVSVLGHREDVASMLSDCALTINPLAAIRGSPVKVIESLSAGRACVTTAEGARGFVDLLLPGLVVAPSVAGMAEPIARLLGDARERHAVEHPDPASLAPFQWDACARPLEALYASLRAAP